MTESKALKLAIEVLKNSQDYKMGRVSTVEAVADIERALAQPETPYEVGRRIAKTGGGMSQLWSAVSHDGELAEAERGFKDAQLKEPEQERKLICKMFGTLPIYDTPSQPKDTEQKSVTTEREAIAVWLEKECDEQFLADRVRAGDYAKEKGHTENCAALADDIGKRHLSPSLVGVGESNSTSLLEQEPVAWKLESGQAIWFERTDPEATSALPPDVTATPLYTSTPAQRTWVGLTRRERFEIEKAMSKYYDYQHECKTVCLPEFAAAIEAKLKEKNT